MIILNLIEKLSDESKRIFTTTFVISSPNILFKPH